MRTIEKASGRQATQAGSAASGIPESKGEGLFPYQTPLVFSIALTESLEQANIKVLANEDILLRTHCWSRCILGAQTRGTQNECCVPPGGGGTPICNGRGCSSEILNLTPKGDYLGVAQAFCDP